MALVIVENDSTKPQYLIFSDHRSYGINDTKNVMNRWTSGLTIEDALKKIGNVSNFKIENIETYKGMKLNDFTIGHFIKLLTSYDYIFTDSKSHTLRYRSK
jgi:hypothetical protein